MKRARQPSCGHGVMAADRVALAPLGRPAPQRGRPATGAEFAQAAKRGQRAAPADHPADADGAAALRHAAAVDAVRGRRAVRRDRRRSRPSRPRAPGPAGYRGRRRRPRPKPVEREHSGGDRVGRRAGLGHGRVAQGRVRLRRYGARAPRRAATAWRSSRRTSSSRRALRSCSAARRRCFPTSTRSSTTSSRPRGRTRSTSAAIARATSRASVMLTSPGVVEVFCNIHATMNGDDPGRPEHNLRQGRADGNVPHRERSGGRAQAGRVESRRQAGASRRSKCAPAGRPRSRSRWNTRARRLTPTNLDSRTGHTRK